MKQRPFENIEGTDTDDKAYLLESRSLALLRLAPVFLILSALVVGALSLYIEPNGERLVRLAEIVISGSLGSLSTTSLVTAKRDSTHQSTHTNSRGY